MWQMVIVELVRWYAAKAGILDQSVGTGYVERDWPPSLKAPGLAHWPVFDRVSSTGR